MWPHFSLKFQNRRKTLKLGKNLFHGDALVKVYNHDHNCKRL